MSYKQGEIETIRDYANEKICLWKRVDPGIMGTCVSYSHKVGFAKGSVFQIWWCPNVYHKRIVRIQISCGHFESRSHPAVLEPYPTPDKGEAGEKEKSKETATGTKPKTQRVTRPSTATKPKAEPTIPGGEQVKNQITNVLCYCCQKE